jgi:DNA-binding NarL/FixJ family response regulator
MKRPYHSRIPPKMVAFNLLTQGAAARPLVNAGFKVVGIARNAEQANATASRQFPNLAVMDIRLANGDNGIDAAIVLLQRVNLRCIFVTAQSDRESRTHANAADPLRWLEKPFTQQALVCAVTEALGRSCYMDMAPNGPRHLDAPNQLSI